MVFRLMSRGIPARRPLIYAGLTYQLLSSFVNGWTPCYF